MRGQSQKMGGGIEEEEGWDGKDTEDDGNNGNEESHEGVRLCGECSVGHCPECGTQQAV